MEKIQSHAKVVVIGGGIMGVSLLYHLAKEDAFKIHSLR